MFKEQKRVLGLYFFFLLVFSFLIGRLYYIQFVNGPNYAKQAAGQRLKTLDYVQYTRGQILDRFGEPLTNDIPRPCVVVFPVMITDFSETAGMLSEILALPYETVLGRLGSRDKKGSWEVVKNPFILKANVGETETAKIRQAGIPGVYVLSMVPRYRPGLPAVHLIGNVGSPSKEELLQYENENSTPQGNVIGKSGLEKQFDNILYGGESPKVAVIVDDRGRALSGLGFTVLPKENSENGNPLDVELTIESKCQTIVEEALDGLEGAVVVMDVNTGDIRALASSPKFEPYLLEEPAVPDIYINKALQNYAPASVFKILIAAAALEESIVNPEDMFSCQGKITIPGGREVSCWLQDGHGEISFAQGMSVSCNPVFIETGLKLGGERIINYVRKFGLDDDTIIGYSTSKAEHFNFNSEVPGDVANVSIGENGIRLSPVLVAKLVSEVANGGMSVTPRLVTRIKDAHGQVVKEFFLPTSKRVISSSTAEALKAMLHDAVREGTGQPAQLPGLETAGKTGSSQTDGVWFAGFAPVKEPQWTVVVFIKDGASGASDAAPVFRKILSRLAVS